MGKPPDPLQRLHDTARVLRARVLAPLGKAATSRPEEGKRDHSAPDISSDRQDVKGGALVAAHAWKSAACMKRAIS